MHLTCKPTFTSHLEGSNFAKIVLNAAILTLAKTKVLHKITAAAAATKHIMEGDSGHAEYSNFTEYDDTIKLVYILAPKNYADRSKKRDLTRDSVVWERIAEIAQHKFEKAIPEDKFKVDTPSASPYFLLL
jgi:hypothetical protein